MQNQYKYTTYNSSRTKKTKKKGGCLFKKIFFGLILFLFIGGIIYALFFCPVIRIKEVKVSGVNAEISSQIQDRTREFLSRKILFVFPSDGIVLFSSDEMKADLESLSAVKNVSVDWNMPNSLEIKAKERSGVLNWCGFGGCAVIDESGNKISEALNADFPVVNDNCLSDKIDERKIKFIMDISDSLLKIDLKPAGFSLENCFTQKLVSKVSGFEVYFDLLRPLDEQVEVLYNVLSDKNRVIEEYVDLQVEERVFYK